MVAIVRSGSSLERLKITIGNEKYKKGRKYLIAYVGVIGEQKGLDLLSVSAKLVITRNMDVQFAIIGGRTDLEKIKYLAAKEGIEEHVDFYGRVSN